MGDQFPDRGFFYRSDQFNFAKIGVPAIYLDAGTEFIGKPEDWGKQQIEEYEEHRYHQPSDEIRSRLELRRHDRGRPARLLRRPPDRQRPTKLPAWNPGDEFEAARKKALAEVMKGK